MTKKTKLRSKKPSKKRTKKKQSGGIGLRQNLKKFDDFRRALLIKWGDEHKCLICNNKWTSAQESGSDKKWYYNHFLNPGSGRVLGLSILNKMSYKLTCKECGFQHIFDKDIVTNGKAPPQNSTEA